MSHFVLGDNRVVTEAARIDATIAKPLDLAWFDRLALTLASLPVSPAIASRPEVAGA